MTAPTPEMRLTCLEIAALLAVDPIQAIEIADAFVAYVTGTQTAIIRTALGAGGTGLGNQVIWREDGRRRAMISRARSAAAMVIASSVRSLAPAMSMDTSTVSMPSSSTDSHLKETPFFDPDSFVLSGGYSVARNLN